MRGLGFLGLALTCAALSGCSTVGRPEPYNTSDTQEEAASVHVAVQSVQAWDDAKPSLTTAFKLTEGEALQLANPTTSVRDQSFAQGIVGTLGLSLPTTSVSKTTTYEDDRLLEGVEVDKFARTETTSRGEPGDPTRPTLTRPDGRVPDALRTIQQDPFIQGQTARNLIHFYALLNQEIDNVLLPDGSKAYLVRLQVSVSPNKRRQPYDVTIDIGAFQTDAGLRKAQESPSDIDGVRLLPLVITDQIERSMQSQAELVMLQLGMSAQGGMGQAGAKANAGYASEGLRNALSAQYNSLYSLAQLNANTLRVRFGAQSNGAGFETITRNHLVTFLMIVPRAVAQSGDFKERQFQVVTRAYLSDARNGRRMDLRSEVDGIRATSDEFGHFYDIYEDFALNCTVLAARQYQHRKKSGLPFGGCVENSLQGDLRERIRHQLHNNDADQRFNARRIAHLAAAAQEGDHAKFEKILNEDYVYEVVAATADCARAADARPLTAPNEQAKAVQCVRTPPFRALTGTDATSANESRAKTLYLELQRLRGTPRVTSPLTLPQIHPADYPMTQSVLLQHDDKSAQARLYGGRGLEKRRLTAILKISTKEKQTFLLPATSSDFDGRKVDLNFPALSAIGEPGTLKEAQAWVCLRDPKVDEKTVSDVGCPESKAIDGHFAKYDVVLPSKKETLPKIGVIASTSDVLVAVGGAGQARLQITIKDSVEGAVLSVTNASIKAASGPGEVRGLGRYIPGKDATTKKPALVTLELENLSAGADVVVVLSPPEGVTTVDKDSKTLKVVSAPKA